MNVPQIPIQKAVGGEKISIWNDGNKRLFTRILKSAPFGKNGSELWPSERVVTCRWYRAIFVTSVDTTEFYFNASDLSPELSFVMYHPPSKLLVLTNPYLVITYRHAAPSVSRILVSYIAICLIHGFAIPRTTLSDRYCQYTCHIFKIDCIISCTCL